MRKSSPGSLLGWSIPILLIVASLFIPSSAVGQSKSQKKKKAAALAAAAKLGQQLFGKNCVACHGANGIGGEGPNLHKLALSDSGISFTIKKGREGEMPAFGGKLKDAQIKSLTAYLRTLK